MNKVILIGNLTRDPEISRKQGDNGKTTIIGKFDLAVGKKFRSENGPDSDFFHCVIFGKSAEFLEKFFKKGTKAAISGRIENNNYVNKDGDKVYGFNIIVDELEFAQKKSKENEETSDSDEVDGEPPFR